MLNSLAFLDNLRQLELEEKKKNLYRIPYFALKNENEWANEILKSMTKSQIKIWQKICYLEAYGEKGYIDCTNKYLAKTLSVSMSTVERAMRFFRENDLIWCNSYAKRKKNRWFGRKRVICTVFNVNYFLDNCIPKIPLKKRKRELNLFRDWMKKNSEKNQNDGCIECSTKLYIDSNFIYKRTSEEKPLETRKSGWICPDDLADKEENEDLGGLIQLAYDIARQQKALHYKREELKKYVTWAWYMKKDHNKKFYRGIVPAAIHAVLHGYAMQVVEKDRLMRLGEICVHEKPTYFDLYPHLHFEFGRHEPPPMAKTWEYRAKSLVNRIYNEYPEEMDRLGIALHYDCVEINNVKTKFSSPYVALALFNKFNIYAEECKKIIHTMRLLLLETYAKHIQKKEICCVA